MTYYITPTQNMYRRMHALRHAMNHWMRDEAVAEGKTDTREMLLSVDVQNSDEAYLITAMVPGLSADDLDIEALGDTLTIQGEFRPTEVEGARYLLSELPGGRFSRTITLPTEVEAAKIEARVSNGLLTLSLPKAEAHRPKSIKVVAN